MHSTKKYIALGFDIDLTLVKYKLLQLAKHSAECVLKTLVEEKSYPPYILNNLDEDNLNFFFNNLLIDLVSERALY
jgi:hypothetical protein